MAKQQRVALMLDLDHLFKRHFGIFAGAQRYAQERCWDTVIDEFADDTLARATRNELPYEGIIARASSALALHATRLGLPLVNIWISSPVWQQLPGVFPDWANVGRLQAQHLLARGYRRFAGLTLLDDRSQSQIEEGFKQAVSEAGCTCTTARIALSPSASVQEWRISERTITAWMDGWQPPLGVFIGSEAAGRIVAQMCRGRNLRVPQDVAIISGTNEELICESLRPTLSSTEIGFDRVGYEAARLLDRLMAGEKLSAERILLPAQGLVVRESTDFIAVEDDLTATALAFIAANFQRDIRAEDVARSLNIHPRKLQRQFHEFLGRSISSEIRSVRLERAKQALTQTQQSVAQIARAVGFGSVLRMCSTFQREVGVSPKQYRAERQ